MTRAHAILSAIKAALTTIPGQTTELFPVDPALREDGGKIHIRAESDNPRPSPNQTVMFDLSVVIDVIARADDPALACDALAEQVHAKMMLDTNFAGLCNKVRYKGRAWDLEAADLDACKVAMEYEISYQADIKVLI